MVFVFFAPADEDAAVSVQPGVGRLDDYARDVKVSNTELAAVNLHSDDFHPDWNYTIKPST